MRMEETKVFEISGKYYKENCMPSLNDLLHAAERHPMVYNRLKKDLETVVVMALRRDLKSWKPEGRVRLDIVWGEKLKGTKRDYDNIVSAGRKIINDAMVKSGYLKDDNPLYLGYGENLFIYTEKPYIKVKIVPIEPFSGKKA